jgi:hypothetical protein
MPSNTFEKYQHIVRYGTPGVQGIEVGQTFVFPKLDGTNASVWWGDSKQTQPGDPDYPPRPYVGLQAGSRRRHLTPNYDHFGFYQYVRGHEGLRELLYQRRGLRLCGEWLVKHTIKTYRDDAWRKFYVFDVMYGDKYLPYDEYKPILDDFGVDYIPCIREVIDGCEETYLNIAEQNDYLMQPGEIGEGIVIKNYQFVNRFGTSLWAKIVRSEFKERNMKTMGAPVQKGKKSYERKIAERYVTQALVDKELAKIMTQPNWPQSAALQPRLLSTVYYSVLSDDIPDIVKRFKNPTIDFKMLQHQIDLRVKDLAPQLF